MDWIIPDWPAPDGVKAICTTRCGGVSTGCYNSMNLAHHVGDAALHVTRNRRILQQQASLPSEPVWLRQVHGARLVKAENAGQEEAADASYSITPGIVCAVLTADCLPILLYDQRHGYVAAVHAGWKGLAAGVIETTIDAVSGAEWMAWLGPAIGPEAFEVGVDVYRAFVPYSGCMTDALLASGPQKWHADIYEIARIILRSRGIERIYGGRFCTLSEPRRFFSYRRDRVTGRMASLIWRESAENREQR